jgi:hypothetical protein
VFIARWINERGDDRPDHGDMTVFELASQLGPLVIVYNAVVPLLIEVERLVGLRGGFLGSHDSTSPKTHKGGSNTGEKLPPL